MNKLDPAAFDAMVRGARPEALWGLPAIAGALGVSADTVSRWERSAGEDGGGAPSIPIRRVGGRWFALRSELEAWRAGR